MSCLCIVSEPRIYAEWFAPLFEDLAQVEMVDEPLDTVDVVLFVLSDTRQPHVDLLPDPPPGAKLVAFSPRGDYGRVRLPGESDWEEIRPFGLSDVFTEVLAGRERALVGYRT